MKFVIALLFLLVLRSEATVCSQDAKKFCSGIVPGKGQLAKCLEDFQDQLTPQCAAELNEFKKKTGSKNPCFEDLADFCQDLPNDAKKIDYCLLHFESKLGDRCASDFARKKGSLIVSDVCAQDIATTCYNSVSGPEGSITHCLIKNKKKLAGHCTKAIENKISEMKKKNPCFDETEKLCPTQVQFIDIHECMVKKLKILSPLCKKIVQSEVDKEKANPCYTDLRRHCRSGLSSSEQHHCLSLNEKNLSNACLQYRETESLKLKKMVELCEGDRLKLCPTAPFQNGMILKCLKENSAKVSPLCLELIK